MNNLLNPHLIDKEFVVLSPDKSASIETCDSTLYQRLDDQYNNFKSHELIACYEFTEDWPSWEIHPHGDEVVVLLSGSVTFVLKLDSGEKSVSLDRDGAYITVPKNVWHTARTSEKSKLLFITPGEGTRHEAV